MSIRRFGLVCAVVCASWAVQTIAPEPLGSRAFAQESAGDFDADYEAARSPIEDDEWKKAREAITLVLAGHEGSLAARARLNEIEEDLQLCLFNEGRKPPNGEELFGANTKRFSRGSRQITLDYSNGPGGPLWQPLGGGLQMLDIRFDGTLSVTLEGQFVNKDNTLLMALFCYDPEKNGGYLFTAGVRGGGQYQAVPSSISVLEDGGVKELDRSRGMESGKLVIARQGTKLTLKNGSTSKISVSDYTFTSGYFALKGDAVTSLEISGRVDKADYRRKLAEYQGLALAEWRTKEYRREDVLPAWLYGEVEATHHERPSPLPSDCRAVDAADALLLIDKLRTDGLLAAVTATAKLGDFPPRTRLFLQGLIALELGNTEAAVQCLDTVIEREPKFAAAYVARAEARFSTRDWKALEADLGRAAELDPYNPQVATLRAVVHLFEGDLDGANAVVGEAGALGVTGQDLEQVQGWVTRARRGPRWTQKFEHETEHFHVMSDQGKKLCYDIAQELESSRRKYEQVFGKPPRSERKSRVYVFAARDGFLEYGADLGMRLDFAAGAYSPHLRELVMFATVDRTELDQTARHEGFHQYAHGFLENIPPWFNEGHADFLGGEPWLRKAKDQAETRRTLRPADIVPIRRFLMLEQSAFMLRADQHYAQAEALVALLRTTKDARFKGLADRYFEGLREGKSQQTCYEELFADVHTDLDEALLAFITSRQ